MVETQNNSKLSVVAQRDQKRIKEIFQRFEKSFGAMTVTLQFLEPIEQLKMQVLSTYWYKIAISRVQTSCRLAKRVFYFHERHTGFVAVQEDECPYSERAQRKDESYDSAEEHKSSVSAEGYKGSERESDWEDLDSDCHEEKEE